MWLALLGVLWISSVGLASAADPQSGIAAWKRWTSDPDATAGSSSGDAGTSRAADFSSAVKARPDAMERLVGKWASGPAPLPWTEIALELVVKYQQPVGWGSAAYPAE